MHHTMRTFNAQKPLGGVVEGSFHRFLCSTRLAKMKDKTKAKTKVKTKVLKSFGGLVFLCSESRVWAGDYVKQRLKKSVSSPMNGRARPWSSRSGHQWFCSVLGVVGVLPKVNRSHGEQTVCTLPESNPNSPLPVVEIRK